jgi:hypothetical protein
MNRFVPIKRLTGWWNYIYRTLTLAPGTTGTDVQVHISGLLNHGRPEVAPGALHLHYTGVGENTDIGVIGGFQEFWYQP